MANTEAAALRSEAAAIFRAAVAAVDPARLVAAALGREGRAVAVRMPHGGPCRWPPPTLVVGAGKAAARMAAGCEQTLGAAQLSGEVIVADGCAVDLESISVTEAGHPLPDARGVGATHRLLDLVATRQANGVLCLISGGASSLLVSPRPPVSLDDKIRTTRLLLDSGADIAEVNTVRKHLSLVKGGGLLRRARAPVAALLISDVVGDEPGTIGSGPASPDATTFGNAWNILLRHGLASRVPETVSRMLRDGMDGRVPETVKPDDPVAGMCRSCIVGSNRTALEGAAREARRRGWSVVVEPQPVVGDTTEAARNMAARLGPLGQRLRKDQAICLLAGGETTVQVRGTGRGGRNQEFALALAHGIAGMDALVLSAGTDGVDGPTPAAGAFVDGTTVRRAHAAGLDVAAALANNDSHTFFSQLGDLYECGPTGTNVMDIKVALLRAVPR